MAAAGGTPAPLARRQHRHAKWEFGVVADVGEISRRGPDHRRLLFEKVLRRCAPFDDACWMHLVLSGEIDPVAKRLDDFGLVVEGAVSLLIREHRSGLSCEPLEQPVRKTR